MGLFEDAADVRLYRLFADVQPGGDFPVLQPLRDEHDNLLLFPAQGIYLVVFPQGLRLIEDRPDLAIVDPDLPRNYGLQGLLEECHVRVSFDHPGQPIGEEYVNNLVLFQAGVDQDDFRLGPPGHQILRQVVGIGHDHIGLKTVNHAKIIGCGYLTLSHIPGQKLSQCLAEKKVTQHDQYFHR